MKDAREPGSARLSSDARRALEHALLGGAAGGPVSDEELAVVAEQGVGAIPEEDRERVLNALANNHEGAWAAVDVHVMILREQKMAPAQARAPLSETLRVPAMRQPRRSNRLLYVSAVAAWALAASVVLVSGVSLLVPASPVEMSPGNTEQVVAPAVLPDGQGGERHKGVWIVFASSLSVSVLLPVSLWLLRRKSGEAAT